MEKGNRNTVLLTVIGIATLLVALVGATFAYFTASVNTSGVTAVTVTTTQVSGLTLTSGKSEVGSVIYPGWVGFQYIDVSATGAATSTATYSLALTVSGTGTGLTSMLGNVQYAVCKKLNQGTAADSSAFASTTMASATVSNNQYSMTNGNVALPSSDCTAVTADVASPFTSGTKLTSTGAKAIATGQTITGTKHDQYYVVYRYLNNGDQSSEMGSSFTVTPTISVSAS